MPENNQKDEVVVNRILKWFRENGRNFIWREENDPYKILIVEKMLQKTTCLHVQKIYPKFIEKYPTIKALSNANQREVEELIKPLGFHKKRSQQFIDIAEIIVKKHSGIVPNKKAQLMKLPGIGYYIANAVLCFAFNEDVPIIDVNVRRVMSRVFEEERDSEIEGYLISVVPSGLFKEINWGIIDLSSTICNIKPKCIKCVLIDICTYYKIYYQDVSKDMQ